MTGKIQVDETKLRQKAEFLDSMGLKSWSDFEAYARCLVYFDEREKSSAYFLEAADKIERPLAVFEKNNPNEHSRLKLVQANYYRLAGERERSRVQYEQLAGELEDRLNNGTRDASLFSHLSYCHFFLQNYEKAIHFGKKVKEWNPISVGFSEGVLLGDQERIQETLDDVISEIQKEKSLPYYTGAEVSLWDWYEIGKELSQAVR